MTSINLSIITEPRGLESLSDPWNYLAQNYEDSSIFLTHEWISTWWRYFSSGNEMNVLFFKKSNEPIGIIPLMLAHHPLGPTSICTLETIGATSDNRVWVISSKHRDAIMTAFLDYLHDRLTGIPLIARLELVPDDSQFIQLLREKGPLHQGLLVGEKTVSLAPYIPLHQYRGWNHYFASLSPNRRRILRRKTRQLEKAHQVEYRIFATDGLLTGLNTLFELHQRRWQSVNIRSPFSDAKVREFYRELSLRLLRRGYLHFSHLCLDGVPASVLYGFVFNDKFVGATCARDPRYCQYGIGHIHHTYTIKEMLEKGLREFDFLRGDEPYKFHWTSNFRKYLRVTIGSNRPLAALQIKLLMTLLRASEVIEHRHSLKELYSIVRLEMRERREKKAMGLLPKLK